jgi:hypothetical protein
MDVELQIILLELIRAIQLCWYGKPTKYFFNSCKSQTTIRSSYSLKDLSQQEKCTEDLL